MEKLKITKLKENDDYRNGIKYEFGGVVVSFIDGGEPEDAYLYRDYSDVYKIRDLIKAIYPEIEIEEHEEVLDNF